MTRITMRLSVPHLYLLAIIAAAPIEQDSEAAAPIEQDTGRRLSFHGIKRFFTHEEDRVREQGRFNAHQTSWWRGVALDSSSEWWADKKGNFHGQAKQDKIVVQLYDGIHKRHHHGHDPSDMPFFVGTS